MMVAIWVLALFAICHGVSALPANAGPEYLDMLRATGRDEEFARLMGIPNATLVRESQGRSEDSFTFGELGPFGDILLTPEQKEQARQGILMSKYPGSKWKNNVIPYYINPDDFSTSQRNYMVNCIEDLNNKLKNLKMRSYRSGDQDYVYVISGNGCYARLGRTGGEQPVSIQKNGCMRAGTIQHEFIHCSGFLHEHMRPDRDDNIVMKWENIPEKWKSQYDKASSADIGKQAQYDPYSVMHYPVAAPETGKPAFEVKDKSIDQKRIGQRDGPTPTDIIKIDKLYE